METMTVSGTDKRLDDLRADTSQGLARVDADVRELRGEGRVLRAEMKAGFDKVDKEFTAVRAEMNSGFDRLQTQMTRFFAGTLGTIIAGVVVNFILSHS